MGLCLGGELDLVVFRSESELVVDVCFGHEQVYGVSFGTWLKLVIGFCIW